MVKVRKEKEKKKERKEMTPSVIPPPDHQVSI